MSDYHAYDSTLVKNLHDTAKGLVYKKHVQEQLAHTMEAGAGCAKLSISKSLSFFFFIIILSFCNIKSKFEMF